MQPLKLNKNMPRKLVSYFISFDKKNGANKKLLNKKIQKKDTIHYFCILVLKLLSTLVERFSIYRTRCPGCRIECWGCFCCCLQIISHIVYRSLLDRAGFSIGLEHYVPTECHSSYLIHAIINCEITMSLTSKYYIKCFK